MIAQEIKKQGGYIIVTSDAHYCDEVGDYPVVLRFIGKHQFPQGVYYQCISNYVSIFFEFIS